jgi:crotonobetainyl-CoA:carnitine CoA-transferase CaiB-like acyl-CoA transferase
MMTSKPTDILAGVKVLDLCRDLAGPLASMMLAECGADVIEVEHPDTGDETRHWPPLKGEFSGYFATMNRSKRSLALDLKDPDALKAVHDIGRGADVVMQSFTPGVADRLGLGYEVFKELNPGVIYYSVSGYGHTGPYRTKRGYDPILQAMSGFMSITGEKGRGPVKTMMPIADVSSAIYGFASILGALYWRERGGKGQSIDMSMFDVMVSMLSVVGTRYLITGNVPMRNGTENPQRVPSAAFECADGGFLQTVPNQRQWPLFSTLLGHPEWGDDSRFATPSARVDHADILYPMVREAMKGKTAFEWRQLFDENGIVCGPINDLADVFSHEQVLARGMVQHYEAPDVGQVPGINLPFRFSQSTVGIRRPPPRLGEHSEEVLRELGRTPEEIAALLKKGAVRGLGSSKETRHA